MKHNKKARKQQMIEMTDLNTHSDLCNRSLKDVLGRNAPKLEPEIVKELNQATRVPLDKKKFEKILSKSKLDLKFKPDELERIHKENSQLLYYSPYTIAHFQLDHIQASLKKFNSDSHQKLKDYLFILSHGELLSEDDQKAVTLMRDEMIGVLPRSEIFYGEKIDQVWMKSAQKIKEFRAVLSHQKSELITFISTLQDKGEANKLLAKIEGQLNKLNKSPWTVLTDRYDLINEWIDLQNPRLALFSMEHEIERFPDADVRKFQFLIRIKEWIMEYNLQDEFDIAYTMKDQFEYSEVIADLKQQMAAKIAALSDRVDALFPDIKKFTDPAKVLNYAKNINQKSAQALIDDSFSKLLKSQSALELEFFGFIKMLEEYKDKSFDTTKYQKRIREATTFDELAKIEAEMDDKAMQPLQKLVEKKKQLRLIAEFASQQGMQFKKLCEVVVGNTKTIPKKYSDRIENSQFAEIMRKAKKIATGVNDQIKVTELTDISEKNLGIVNGYEGVMKELQGQRMSLLQKQNEKEEKSRQESAPEVPTVKDLVDKEPFQQTQIESKETVQTSSPLGTAELIQELSEYPDPSTLEDDESETVSSTPTPEIHEENLSGHDRLEKVHSAMENFSQGLLPPAMITAACVIFGLKIFPFALALVISNKWLNEASQREALLPSFSAAPHHYSQGGRSNFFTTSAPLAEDTYSRASAELVF